MSRTKPAASREPKHDLLARSSKPEARSASSPLRRCSFRFHVTAKFLAHGGKNLLRKCVLLPRTKARVESGCQHFRGNGFFERRLDRPTPLARILHITAVL